MTELGKYLDACLDSQAARFPRLPISLIKSVLLPYTSLSTYVVCFLCNQSELNLDGFKAENDIDKDLLRVITEKKMPKSSDLAMILLLHLDKSVSPQEMFNMLDRSRKFWSWPLTMLHLLERGAQMNVSVCEVISWSDSETQCLRKFLANNPSKYSSDTTFLNYTRSGANTFFDMAISFNPDFALELIDTPGLNLKAVNFGMKDCKLVPHAVADSLPIRVHPRVRYSYTYLHDVLTQLETARDKRQTLWRLAEVILHRHPDMLLAPDSNGQTPLHILRRLVDVFLPLES